LVKEFNQEVRTHHGNTMMLGKNLGLRPLTAKNQALAKELNLF